MPYTVNNSFSQFRTLNVDLDREEVKKARKSRDYLKEQINRLSETKPDFPKITKDYMSFGSFSRNTKVRPLDDIDIMVILNGSHNTSYSFHFVPHTYYLKAEEGSYLWRFTNNDGNVNSTKILNSFKNGLKQIKNYRKADINKQMQAVVLNLTSYTWVYDVIPAIPIGSGYKIDHYLIPDGKGHWIRTDPRRDQSYITNANQYHNNNLIPIIRLIKYWNVKRYSPPKIGSYYLETMIINGFRSSSPITNIRYSIPNAFQNLSRSLGTICSDPKGLGPNLDESCDIYTKQKVQQVAYDMANIAYDAIQYERYSNHQSAIRKWQSIFPNFPNYG